MKSFTIPMILFYTMLIFSLPGSAQIPNNVWARQFGPAGGILGEPRSILADAWGNVYVTGIFSDTNDFDPGIGVHNLTAVAGSDIFIMKLDASGNLIWVNQISGNGDDIANSMAFDAAGNLYVTGYFKGSADFDAGPGVNLITASDNFSDVFILKLNPDGAFIWVKHVGGNDDQGSFSIAIDPADNVLIAGVFWGTTDFNPGAGITTLTAAGVTDKFILKLDPQGNFLWVKQIGENLANVNPGSIKTDKDGNIISTGYYSGACDFDPGSGVKTLSSDNGYAAYILKLDSSGNFVWANSFKGSNANVYSRSLAVDETGNIYSTGSFRGTVDFDSGIGQYDLTSATETGFVSKITAAGNFTWAKAVTEISSCIALDKQGLIYIGSNGNNGYSITKLTNNNDVIWSVSFGNELNKCNTITVDEIGNIYTGGYFSDATDFDPGTGVYSLTAISAADIYVHKLNQLMPVPVSFISFDAKTVQNGNQLNWEVAGAGDPYRTFFEIEKSIDGIKFPVIARLNAGINKSSYTYTDFQPSEAINYYRIRQKNESNVVYLSKIIKISRNSTILNKINIYPNPIINSVTINLNHSAENASIRILNVKGQVVLAKENFYGSYLKLAVTGFEKGFYIFELIENNTINCSKIMKD